MELSVRPTAQFPTLLAGRTVDVAIGPAPAAPPEGLVSKVFLSYEVIAVAGPDHPLAGRTIAAAQARSQEWLLGPSAVGADGVVAGILRQLRIPESQQRIFQSDAGALEETRRTDGLSLAVRHAVTDDLRAGRLTVVDGPGMRAPGRWAALALLPHHQVPATAELLRFITTPRATQAMVRGAGAQVGRFRPSVHVTLWS